MTRRLFMLAVGLLSTLALSAQRGDPYNPYLVWTNNVVVSKEKSDSVATEEENDSTASSFVNTYFRHYSLCEWKKNMKFMVIPDKKDMVIRTFADASTGMMVSSMSLRHKILLYQGHTDGELHDRIYFALQEDTTKQYYYEIPTASFDDYCGTKFGVPTLAYLGDVDAAIENLMGKKLLTNYPVYNVDVNTTSYGYDKINVDLGTEVTVVAAGVGTRQFPVKLIVADASGKEFFQTVAISRTNSGLRDEEFGEDNLKHTFEGSFEMMGDMVASDEEYARFVGNSVYTLYETRMELKDGTTESIPRLTNFKILRVKTVKGTNDVILTLVNNDKEFTKKVTFVRESVVGDIAGQREDYYYSLFASGNLGDSKTVRKENMPDIQKNIVRVGFNESEVKLALGDPNEKRTTNRGQYQWIYKSALDGSRNRIVVFDSKKKTVITIKQ